MYMARVILDNIILMVKYEQKEVDIINNSKQYKSQYLKK